MSLISFPNNADQPLFPPVADFPSGTLMTFQQSAAPTGWVKQTTHNDKALRVVSGSASSGGTFSFSTAFSARTSNSPSTNTSDGPSTNNTGSTGPNTGGPSTNTTTGPSTNTTDAHTLTVAEMPSHSHIMQMYNSDGGNTGPRGNISATGIFVSTSSVGGDGGHTHTMGSHTHDMGSHFHAVNGHTHDLQSHTHTMGNHTHATDMTVQYVDLIIAQKT